MRDRLRAAATELHMGDGYIVFASIRPRPSRSHSAIHAQPVAVSGPRDRPEQGSPRRHRRCREQGDDTLLDLGATAGWHFPQLPDGAYAGHPDDSEDAVAHLEALRSKGTRFLLIPGWATWWLDHYDGYRRHLKASSERAWSDDDCILYDLSANA